MSNRASSFVDSVAQSFCIHQYTNSTNAFVSNSVFPPRKTQVQIDICKTKFQLPPSYIRWDKFPLFISFLLLHFWLLTSSSLFQVVTLSRKSWYSVCIRLILTEMSLFTHETIYYKHLLIITITRLILIHYTYHLKNTTCCNCLNVEFFQF